MRVPIVGLLVLTVSINYAFAIIHGDGHAKEDRGTEESNKALYKKLHDTLNPKKGDYDSTVRPKPDGPAVAVDVDIVVLSISDINEEHMEYTVNIFLGQRWTDTRLALSGFSNHSHPLTGGAKIAEKLWVPGLYFPNEKRARVHDVTVPNVLIRIFPNGTITSHIQLTLSLSCPMMLTHFPLDTQRCDMYIESYNYDAHDVVLKWARVEPYHLDAHMRLPEFEIVGISMQEGNTSYAVGQWSNLTAQFSLHRLFGYYLCHSYIPSYLIVILSWVSFWISMDAVPARVTLGVVAVLTIITLFSGSRAHMPKVSYPTSLDVWMAICMVFVFGSLLQYGFVNVFNRQTKKVDRKPPKKAAPETIDEAAEAKPGLERQESIVADLESGILKVLYCFKTDREVASAIDKFSRFFFPISFIVVNIIYWGAYLGTEG